MKTVILGCILILALCILAYPYVDLYAKNLQYNEIIKGQVARNAGVYN